MQRKFIRETTENLDTDLHKKFVLWVAEQGLNSPTEEEWQDIMEEDSRSVYVMHIYTCMYGWQTKGKGEEHKLIMYIYIPFQAGHVSFSTRVHSVCGGG